MAHLHSALLATGFLTPSQHVFVAVTRLEAAAGVSTTLNVPTALWSLLSSVGLPLLVLLFYLDGMIIGKFLPPAALFVGYIALVTPPLNGLLVAVGLCGLASTLGQWTLYRGFNDESPEYFGLRRRTPFADQIPLLVRTRVGENRMGLVTRIFDDFGGVALCVTNLLPGIRCLVSIPAGLSRYPVGRFLLFSSFGNLVYLLLLVGIAKGVLEMIQVFP